MKKFSYLFAALLLPLFFAAVLAGCGTKAPSSAAILPENNGEEAVTILVAAAASLEDCFKNTLIPMFEEQYPWVTVEGTYDSSGKLQTQIEEGLPASVFMSASPKQMSALAENGLIDKETVVPLLENEIVLIAPMDSDTDIDSFERITEAKTIAIGDPASVPAGQYAEEALKSLGVWDEIQPKTSFGTNVTEVKNQVAEASAEVGIVYATDAAQMPDKLKILAAAPNGSLAEKIIYPVGITAGAPHSKAAELFVEFLQSPEAMEVFAEKGFKQNA